MNKIAILGLGLMGGSIALALKRSSSSDTEIVGYSRRESTSKRAIECGIIDRIADKPDSAVKEADLVFIATPVMAIKDILINIAPQLSPGALVTDMGSTKVKVMEWAKEHLPPYINFIGGHPMAGKELSGIDASDPDIFIKCTYCLIPGDNVTDDAIKELTGIVDDIGAVPFLVDAPTHDRLVAGISHLPMLLSSAFVSSTTSSDSWPEMARLAAKGYRDFSRLASGDPDMNRDICISNMNDIIQWIDCYIKELEEYRRLIIEDDEGLKRILDSARNARDKWLKEDSP